MTEILGNTVSALASAKTELEGAKKLFNDATDKLHDMIIWLRENYSLTVNDMAEAMGRDRNYVDSVWSDRIEGERIDPAWFGLPGLSPEDDAFTRRAEVKAHLASVSDEQRRAWLNQENSRKARDTVIVSVYSARVPGLGPTAIGRIVGLDRNQVGRIARKNGVPPLHRTNIRNQYSDKPTVS